MGGNDLAAIDEDGDNGKPYDEVVADAEQALLLMRKAVQLSSTTPKSSRTVLFPDIHDSPTAPAT